MYRSTLELSDDGDIEGKLVALHREGTRAGLSDSTVAEMMGQVRAVLRVVTEQGSNLAAQGSRMSLSRQIKGEGYELQLLYGAGTPKSWLSRVARSLLGG